MALPFEVQLKAVFQEQLTDLDNLPEPNELAAEIIANLEAGLASFRAVLAGLKHA